MATYKDVELSGGRTVRVYRAPARRIVAAVEKQYPRPQAPVVKETLAMGKEVTMRIDDDPQYLADLAAWEQIVNEKVDEFGSLFVLKDENPPDDWDVMDEVGEEMQYFDPTWKPREGKMGRKLDYIQWVILGDSVDSMRILDAQRELSGIDLEGVAANEASFRGEVEGETS